MSDGISVDAIETQRLLLRPLEVTDAADLHPAWSDPETLRYWHLPPSRDLEETAERIRGMTAAPTQNYWAIRGDPSGPAIGHVGFPSVPPGGRGAFGYLLRRDHWGRGIVPEAGRAVMRHAFEELGAAGAELWIYEGNERSVRVAEKLGCRLRGRFVAFNVMHGTQIPTLVYGVTASEWGGADPAPDPVAFYAVHPVIECLDVQRAIDFYCGRLGFGLDWSIGDPPAAASVSRTDWTPLGATIRLTQVDTEPTARPGWLSIGVDDVDRLYSELRAAGVQMDAGPESMPWGLRELAVVDCNGQRLQFVTPVGTASSNE